MINGMTGFGRGQAQSIAGEASVEIRSTNHRYFELVIHMPASFNVFEDRIRREIQKQISRGRIVFALTFLHSANPKVHVNTKLAKQYYNQLKRLSRTLGIRNDIALQQIVGLEGVVGAVEQEEPSEQAWALIEAATRQALGHLMKMRRAEGRSIYNDISNKAIRIGDLVSAISKRRQEIWQQKKKHITPDDFSAFAKDHDINEESTRLSYHLKSLKKQLAKSGQAGKELDFISQEMQRETNTIGSKLPDEKISHYVIKIKSTIEQIREQAQNTE